MSTPTSPLRIDIISDVMCPWCVIGYRQLAIALDAAAIDHEIYWHPFELNPEMPTEGQDMVEHVQQKYGTSPEDAKVNRAKMKQLGNELDFVFGDSDDRRMYNTFKTHQILHWANEHGRKHDLKQALFAAHFTDARDLSDDAVLADIAAETGLNRDTALSVLNNETYAKDVRQEQQFWISQGIRGVPAVVFDRQHLVTGAQGVDNYKNILGQLREMRS